MRKVTAQKQPDGTETVRLYGTTVDVTGKKEFTLFKKDYKVYRPRKKKVETPAQEDTASEPEVTDESQ